MATKAKRKAGRAYVPARARVRLTPGDSVRIARELQGMTQLQLGQACGMPQGAISSIESGRSTLGSERAERLARALKVHPAILLWPDWDAQKQQRVAG